MPAETLAQVYIAGSWRDASDGGVMDIVDPATEDVIGTSPVATSSDVDAALATVEMGWRQWRETHAWTRSAKLPWWAITSSNGSTSSPQS